MHISFLVLSVVVLFASPSFQKPHGNNHDQNQVSESKDFDYLVLRQIWPKTSCMFPGSHQCTIKNTVSSWVIHGLWPNYNVGFPSFCNKTDKFRPDLIQPIVADLEKYWPNLYTDTPLNSFWQHEWEKHGTCALSLKQVTNERDYFQMTLGLREKFDFGTLLEKASIVPDNSKSYELAEFINAIEKELAFAPVLSCFVEKESKRQFLAEMQICLNKSLEQIDCSEHNKAKMVAMRANEHEQQCSPKMPVHYPVLDRNQKIIFNF